MVLAHEQYAVRTVPKGSDSSILHKQIIRTLKWPGFFFKKKVVRKPPDMYARGCTCTVLSPYTYAFYKGHPYVFVRACHLHVQYCTENATGVDLDCSFSPSVSSEREQSFSSARSEEELVHQLSRSSQTGFHELNCSIKQH